MKLLGCLLIMLSCTLTGAELLRRQTSARDVLNEACSLCLHMSNLVRYERSEPGQIIRSFFSENRTLSDSCCKQLDAGYSFAEAWDIAISELKTSALSPNELAQIKELGIGFGRSDTEGELARLARINEELQLLFHQRADSCRRTGKMYLTTGFLAGMMLMLFMI